MLSPSFRRKLIRPVAAALLLAAGFANAQTTTFAPSVIGKSLTLEGQLEVLVEDYADGHSNLRHFLRTPQDRVELAFTGKAPHLASGTRVRVRGVAQRDGLALDGSAGSIETLATVMPNTMGEQSIAVVLVNFQDATSQPWSAAEANDLVFGAVSNHYRESSFGQAWLKGQVFGWYTIPMSKTVCDANTLASLADAKAAEAGAPLGSFQRRVYVFPANACSWQGLGNVGAVNSTAWVNGVMTVQVVGHELGHNLGLQHAHSLDCDTGVFGDNCYGIAYGDAADMMGNVRAGQFNPFEKEELGWLNDGISPPILTVASSGRYSIEPYSASTVGPKALKIPRGTDGSGNQRWYYVEYRQPIGGDSVLDDLGNLTKGVMVRIATEDNPDSSYQLDMTPGSATKYYEESGDGALAVGQTHVDGEAGVTLALASIDADGADIDVTVGPPVCIRAAPKLSLTGGGAALAGTAVSYSLSVTNRDNRICPASTFALASTVPAGWSGTVAMKNITVNPGTTSGTTITITSDVAAAIGTYSIGATASSVDSTLHAANTSASYTVASCTRATPTIALAGGGTPVRAGTHVGYTLSVTNHDDSVCPATTFNVANSVPAGWAGTLGTTSMTLRGGATASTTLDVASDASAPIGSHGIGAAVGSPLGELHTANASATYAISDTCTRAAPSITLTGGGAPVVPGTTVGYTLNVGNRDSSACPATTFALARSVPAGWVSTLSKTSVALDPGKVGSSRVDLQACKLEYSIVSPK